MNDRVIALIKPSSGRELSYPLGLASLVPPLRAAGYRVEGFDCDLGGIPAFIRGLSNGRYLAIGISVRWGQVQDAASIIRRIKAVDPGMPVFIGGPQPTLFPKESLAETGADIAVAGDGESVFVHALAACLSKGAMPSGTTVRRGTEFELNGGPVFEEDLDVLPVPDRSFLPLGAYGHAYSSYRHPFAAMISSRGCSMSCPHCCTPALRPAGFRPRAPDGVVEEMKILAADYGIKDVHFEDDAFLTDLRRVVSLCEELIEWPGRPIWELVNGVRPEHVDAGLLPLMHRAGCRRIAIGVEAICDDSYKAPPGPQWKPYSTVSGIVSAAAKCGIGTTGYFILGLPGAGPEDDLRTIELAGRMGFNHVHYSVYSPVPGSSSYPLGAGRGGAPETAAMARRAARRFYLNPSRLMGAVIEAARDPAMAGGLAARAAYELAGWEAGLQ